MSSDSNSVIKTPDTPREKFKHFTTKPSPIDLVEISELSPKQCINMGISYLSDDRYEDSFDEEYGEKDCDTQPDSGNIIDNKSIKKCDSINNEDIKNKDKKENEKITNKEIDKSDNSKKKSKLSQLIESNFKE